MDIVGKDSFIWEVFKDLNVWGVVVYSFKVFIELEWKYDYLWCYYIVLFVRGKFGVFNWMYYENVLVICVYFEYILGEYLFDVKSVVDVNEVFWDKCFE